MKEYEVLDDGIYLEMNKYGENTCQKIISRDAFVESYNKWIKPTNEEEAIKEEPIPDGMRAEDMLDIMSRSYPQTFDYWYRECKLIYEANQGHYRELSEGEQNYIINNELNFAKTILYDRDKETAKKIGRILIAATEE